MLEGEYKAAGILKALLVTGGTLTENTTVVASGLLVQSSLYSPFNTVKRIKKKPASQTIFVNSTLLRNQVYVPKEDFDFVYNYIVEHCGQAKIK